MISIFGSVAQMYVFTRLCRNVRFVILVRIIGFGFRVLAIVERAERETGVKTMNGTVCESDTG